MCIRDRYDAINDVKDAMEGLLSPEMKEEITGTAEIRETYKISKVGTIAGCMVTKGKIVRKILKRYNIPPNLSTIDSDMRSSWENTASKIANLK